MASKKMTVWQVDSDGLIIEVVELSKERGDYKEDQWLIPAGCVEVEPPECEEGYLQRWNGMEWEILKYELVDESESEPKQMEETPEILLMRLNNEFAADNQEIMNAYVKARMKEDDALQEELKEEMAELEKDYQVKRRLIESGMNPWEEVSNA